MRLGFENVDKKRIYEKKWKKGRNEEAPPCVSILACLTFIQKTHLAIIMSLSGNDALKLSGAMMV